MMSFLFTVIPLEKAPNNLFYFITFFFLYRVRGMTHIQPSFKPVFIFYGKAFGFDCGIVA
jgi:hypothetical protein